MTVEYQKVWTTMNDLEITTSKICSAREIIDNAVDKIQEHEYDKAELLMTAAYEFLEYYLQEFDDKFKLAWQATVGDLRSGDEFQYTATGEKMWVDDYCDASGLTTPIVYSEEELNAMCDKAELDAQLEQIRKDGGYEWTPEVKKEEKTLSYDEAVAAGWEMTADGFWFKETKKWVLPVEECKDADTDKTDYFVSFPDDLLEAANLKEGDEIEWVDNKDGTYTIRKSTQPLGPDEC